MDVTRLPFNQLIGLQSAAPGSGFAVTLPAGTQYTNHLGTVHGSALLAVAEAGNVMILLFPAAFLSALMLQRRVPAT